MIGTLTHVRLLVRDYPACFRFYRDVMGLRATYGEEDTGYADFDAGGGVAVALFGAADMAAALGDPLEPGARERACLVFSVDDVDAAAAGLAARGAPIVAGPVDRPEWGIRTAHVLDPDGNLIEINRSLAAESQP
jgi:predicted enzyme related to lactoylglutathione lyase